MVGGVEILWRPARPMATPMGLFIPNTLLIPNKALGQEVSLCKSFFHPKERASNVGTQLELGRNEVQNIDWQGVWTGDEVQCSKPKLDE